MEAINSGVATLFRNYTNALLERLCEEYNLPVDEVKSKYMDGVAKKKTVTTGSSKTKKDVVKCSGHTKKGDPCKRNGLYDGMCKKHFEERDEHVDEDDEVDQHAKVSEMIESIEGSGETVPIPLPVSEPKGKGKAKDVAESSKAPKKTKKIARAPTPEFSDELPVMPKIKITKRKKSTAPVPKYKGPALQVSVDSLSGVYTSDEVDEGVAESSRAAADAEIDAELESAFDEVFGDEPEASGVSA